MQTRYQLITDAVGAENAVAEILKHQIVGLDTETTELDPYKGVLRLIQIATPDNVYIFDLKFFPEPDKNEALQPLRRLLNAPRPIKVAHNAKFDAKWLCHCLDTELNGIFDTLLASQLLAAGDTEKRHNLAEAAAAFLQEQVDKTQQISNWSGELSPAQLEYAARDAEILISLREKMVEKLKADGLVKCAQLEFECVMPLVGLELAGIFLDQERWREQLNKVKKEQIRLADELQDMLAEGALQGSLFGRPEINLDSHTQLTDALKRLGVPLPTTTRQWQLEPLAKNYPVIAKLLEYRTVQKAITSYGENILEFINPKTGRIHADFRQIGAPTGRMACLTGDTLVTTPNGLKRMENLQAGDFVKTSFGFKKVQKAWMTGVRDIFLIKLKNGQRIRATKNHQFLTGLADKWEQVKNLQPGNQLYVSVKPNSPTQTHFSSKLKITLPDIRSRKIVNLPDELSVELCELLGLIIADGFLGKRHERTAKRRVGGGIPAKYDRVYIAFGREDQDLINKIISHSLKLFGQSFVELKSKSCRSFQLASTKIAEFLATLGLSGNAHTKTVPEMIMQSSEIYQAAFLRGLFEGDGHCSFNPPHRIISLTSVNFRLLSEVQIMLLNFGIYSIIYEKHDKSGFKGSDRYQLTITKKADISTFMQTIGFISARKNINFEFLTEQTDGIATPFVISGKQLYRDAVNAGVTESSRVGLKPFAQYYKEHRIKGESVEKLINRFGLLPSLTPVKDFLDRGLRQVEIVSITPVGEEKVYDITVEEVHEFIANGIVVHNCNSPNIQQVPHGPEYRRCFRAPSGRKLIIADYSQVELRILADFTGDDGFIKAFKSGADLHKTTAAQVFNVSLEEVTKEQRDFAKRLNFGVVYGIGAKRFALMTGLSETEAQNLLMRYFQTYRKLDAWLRETATRGVREREVRTASGRLARFKFDATDNQAVSQTQRNAKNFPIQGTSADILKRALRLLHEQLRGTSAQIVNVIHDEIVVECDENEADEIAPKVENAMVSAGEEYIKLVPVKVEYQIADEWLK
jgi:DNA polymerase I-like protein with 3'-5' exonuclease and polymerase domains